MNLKVGDIDTLVLQFHAIISGLFFGDGVCEV